jgi:parallel beta-helix repeat protein
MKEKQTQVACLLVGSLLLGIAFVIAEGPEEPVIPGVVEGTGTFFEVRDSEYLNVSLQSSETVKVLLESVPSTVTVHLAPPDGVTSAQLTLQGLAASTTYYKYEDTYENGSEITADATGSYTWMQDLSGPHLVWLQLNPGTKFIRDDATGGDCTSIGGAWDAGTKTCTLQNDVFETIEIRSSNVTLDGAGYTVQGPGVYPTTGVYAVDQTGVTITNLNVINFTYGIFLTRSSDNTLAGNTLSNNGIRGINLMYTSNDNNLTGNTILNNGWDGIWVSPRVSPSRR